MSSSRVLPEGLPQSLVGPALTIGGHLLKWEGRPKTNSSLAPIDLRVNFESAVEDMTTSHLQMENSGTTAVYYSWKVCSVAYHVLFSVIITSISF